MAASSSITKTIKKFPFHVEECFVQRTKKLYDAFDDINKIRIVIEKGQILSKLLHFISPYNLEEADS